MKNWFGVEFSGTRVSHRLLWSVSVTRMLKKRCTKNLGFQGQIFSLNFNYYLINDRNNLDRCRQIEIDKARASSNTNNCHISVFTWLIYQGERTDIGYGQN